MNNLNLKNIAENLLSTFLHAGNVAKDASNRGVKIIIKAQNLEKKSKIRILFEKEKKLICIPVYEDNSHTLTSIIYNFLRENQIKLSQEIINILIERSKGDRINLMNELSKIKSLSFSKKKIEISDIEKLSNLAENYSVFELSDNYLA